MELPARDPAKGLVSLGVGRLVSILHDCSCQIHRSTEDRYRLLVSDLRLTTSYLKVHPKVYWIWTHRMWCLENLPDGPENAEDKDFWRNEVWAKELFTVEKMLEVDSRNCECNSSSP